MKIAILKRLVFVVALLLFLLTPLFAGGQTAHAAESILAIGRVTGIYAGSNLNVRSGPGTGNSLIDSLTNGYPLSVFEERSGWLRIGYEKSGAKKGWVSAGYVQRYTSLPLNTEIYLISTANGNSVTTDQKVTTFPLRAYNTNKSTWEECKLIPTEIGYVAIKFSINQKYASARIDVSGAPLRAVASEIRSYEQFAPVPTGGNWGFISRNNGKYVSTLIGTSGTPLCATGNALNSWETFRLDRKSTPPPPPAPTYALVSQAEYGGHTYKIYKGNASWTLARDYAKSLGGYLACITSEGEQNAVAKMVSAFREACWLGAENTSGSWKWVSGEAFGYKKWAPGEPSGTISGTPEHYVGIYGNSTVTQYAKNSYWNDFRLTTDTIKGFVVEFNIGSSINVSSVAVTPTKLALQVGRSSKLTGTVTPSNATNTALAWTSSNSSIASVDGAGNVTAHKAGTATITAKSVNGKSAKCTVTVTAPKPILPTKVTISTFASNPIKMNKGETYSLVANVYPENATNQKVQWTSSKPKIAKVDIDTGVVTALEGGDATITARTHNGKKATKKIRVTVPVTEVSLNKTTATVRVKGSVQLKASITPSNASNRKVIWETEDGSIATVSSRGKVTGKKDGTTTITAKTEDGARTAKCVVTVGKGNPITSIAISGSRLVAMGETLTLATKLTPTNAGRQTLTWSSDNERIATVSDSGVVTAKAIGACKITVKAPGGVSATSKVFVFKPRIKEKDDAPSNSSPYYSATLNCYFRTGNGMPNCTAYAYGRAYEILGSEPDLPGTAIHRFGLNSNAENWFEWNKRNISIEGGGYAYSTKASDARPGAIACWSGGYGHVAVVERIEGNTVILSNSGYGYKYFYITNTINLSGKSFQGFIFIDEPTKGN